MKNINMDNFKKKFIEEATDTINELEDALLLLEKSQQDHNLIERVFRAMHSLKGGGAMFGFEKISELTHNLESIYDLIRNNKAKLTEEILNITFKSVDHLKALLNEENEDAKELMDNQKLYLTEINKLIVNIESGKQVNPVALLNLSKLENSGVKTYYVFFKPHENIFDNGTNPLFLLDELASLGKQKAFPRLNLLPEYDKIEVDKCYTHWEVFISSKEDISVLHDVFMFVEDLCELEITLISNYDLLLNSQFIEKLNEIEQKNEDVGIDKIRKIVETIKIVDEKNDTTPTAVKVNKEHAISSIRVASEKLDLLMNLVSELVTTQARLSLYTEKNNSPELLLISENIQKLTRQLRDIAFNIVLIPVENMITRFQRLVRDLSKDLNKSIEFIAEGTETELDKNIIESLTDPIMHILRNCIDHGIEDEAVRVKFGKPAKGKILFKAYYSGASVHLQIHDDGAGINIEKVRTKAIEKGLISADAVLSKREIYDLVFLPGFSTATFVTDISGRGVGMDVVKRKIADIRGEVDIDSEINNGTTITIKLPITLSIIDGLLVKISDTHYILPLSAVDKIYAVEHKEIINKYNNLIILDGQQIPFYYLREEFEIQEKDNGLEEVVVVKYEENKIALIVDTVIGEYQAVLKSLGKHYKKQEMVSGGTILGDGTVALVLDTNKMISLLSSNYKKVNQ